MSTQAIATAKEVFDLLRDDLSAIEIELVRDAVSNVGAITDIADYLREGGGKRIRPSLLLLAAKSNPPRAPACGRRSLCSKGYPERRQKRSLS